MPTIVFFMVPAGLVGFAVLGALFGVFAIVPYWSVERRGRARWREAELAPSSHPYRAARVDVPRRGPPRAPALVRSAAMVSFLWGWACVAWAIVVALDLHATNRTAMALLVALPLACAFLAQRAARMLLARAARAVATASASAIAQAALAAALVALGVATKIDEASVADLTLCLGFGALAQAAVVRLATRVHAAAFARA